MFNFVRNETKNLGRDRMASTPSWPGCHLVEPTSVPKGEVGRHPWEWLLAEGNKEEVAGLPVYSSVDKTFTGVGKSIAKTFPGDREHISHSELCDYWVSYELLLALKFLFILQSL